MNSLFLSGIILKHDHVLVTWEHFLFVVGVDDSAPSTVICLMCGAALLVRSERKLLLALVVKVHDGIVEVL